MCKTKCIILFLNASLILLQLNYNSAMKMTTSATTEALVTRLKNRGESHVSVHSLTQAPSVKVRYQNNKVKSNEIGTCFKDSNHGSDVCCKSIRGFFFGIQMGEDCVNCQSMCK